MADSLLAHLAKSSQDVLNFPIRLNDKISGVYNAANSGHFAPSKQVKEVYTDLASQADIQLAKFKNIVDKELSALNQLIREKQVPVIGLKKE
jgi:hypothetical protein